MKYPSFLPLAGRNEEAAPQILINVGPHHLFSIQQVVMPGPVRDQPAAKVYQIGKRQATITKKPLLLSVSLN